VFECLIELKLRPNDVLREHCADNSVFIKKARDFLNLLSFWDIASCGLIEVDRRFKGAYCLHHRHDGGSTL
jgi:hypothetical protein